MHSHIQQYRGVYKDKSGTVQIIIKNDFKELSVEIDGIRFSGREFSDFAIHEKSKHSWQQLKRFTFFKTPVYNTNSVEETLCDCLFECSIPQTVIDVQTRLEFILDLRIEYLLGAEKNKPVSGLEFERMKLSLTIEEQEYVGISDFIEGAFDQIYKQFNGKFKLKNCYGCMYGDYGVGGNSSFGTMLCFAAQKDRYKTVKNKTEYMNLTSEHELVQEIFLCDQYEIRKERVGYRG